MEEDEENDAQDLDDVSSEENDTDSVKDHVQFIEQKTEAPKVVVLEDSDSNASQEDIESKPHN